MITWLPKRVLPVLMYHRLGAVPGDADPNLWISQSEYSRHLDWIAAAGFDTITLDEAHAIFLSRRTPKRKVLITFDDAFADTLAAALPVLADRGMRAAAFVASDMLGRDVELSPMGSTRHESETSRGAVADRGLLLQWHAGGHGIGAHSATHARLDVLSSAELERETKGARSTLQEALGVPIMDFCYPYARHDTRAREQVAAAGFRAAYAGEPPTLDLFALPRMMIFPTDDRRRFARKLSGYYFFLSAWHRRLRARPRAVDTAHGAP